MSILRSPTRRWSVTLAVIGLTMLTGCASAPVASDQPDRVSAEASGRQTASQAADAARQAQPDGDTTSADATRWIYATNVSAGPADGGETAGNDDPGAQHTSTSDTSSKSAIPSRPHANLRVKLFVGTDGTVRAPTTTFETPVAAADWASRALSTTDTQTVELYVAADTDSSRLDALLAALRNADVPQISIVFAPSADAPTEETEAETTGDSSN
jgi:hypothetical protein